MIKNRFAKPFLTHDKYPIKYHEHVNTKITLKNNLWA